MILKIAPLLVGDSGEVVGVLIPVRGSLTELVGQLEDVDDDDEPTASGGQKTRNILNTYMYMYIRTLLHDTLK